nr:phage scaffolding protein [Aminipila sp.]
MTYADLEQALKDSKDIKIGNLAGGQYVDKAKLDGKISELNTANQTIKDLQDAVKKFDGVDIEKLKADVTNWETKYNTDISKVKLENALDVGLMAAKAKSTKAVKALLNLDEIKLDGDNLLGLDTQLEKIKQDNGYLFDITPEDTTQVSSGGEHGDPLKGDIDKFFTAAMSGAGLSTESK